MLEISLITVLGAIITPCCGSSHMADFVFGMHIKHVSAVSLAQLLVFCLLN